MNELKVLAALIGLLNDNQRATRDSIAERAGIGSATVSRSITRLNQPWPEGFGMVVEYRAESSTKSGSYAIADWGKLTGSEIESGVKK